jgi:hypothetical protein
MVHHPVVQRDTAGWGCHNLPVLAFLVRTDFIIRDDSITDEVRESAAHAKGKALLWLGQKSIHGTVLHLLISINLLQSILRQMVEELGVLMHGPSALLQVHEFLMLHSHDARGDGMGVESLTKLIP